MPDISDDRVYSEEEIGRILKEAASLQDRAGPRSTTGLSLVELQQLAKESGIDPRHVESAAMSLAERTEQDATPPLIGPLEMTLKRRITGSVSEETFARMVSETRRALRRTGATSEAGATREWSAHSPIGSSTSLTLRESDGRTDLEVYWTQSQILPIPFIIVPLVGIVVWLGIIINDMALTGLPAAMAVAATVLTYVLSSFFVFRSITKGQRKTIRALTDRISDLAQSAESSDSESAARLLGGESLLAVEEEQVHESESQAIREKQR